jgi:hypothetical protein
MGWKIGLGLGVASTTVVETNVGPNGSYTGFRPETLNSTGTIQPSNF